MRSFLLIIVAIALSFTGCRQPEGTPTWPGGIKVGQERPEHLHPGAVAHTAEPLPAREQDLELVREIASRHEEIFRRDPPQQVMDEAELIFFATGRLPELVEYYEEAIERRHGDTSLLARLGWLYERLGLEDLAFESVKDAAQRRPDDAFAHFALAYTYGQQAERRDDPYPHMLTALERVFELEPTFEVRGVVSHQALREEYNRIKRQHGHKAQALDTEGEDHP